MAKVDSRWRGWELQLLSIMRIITGFLFMQHGAQKIFGLLGGSRGGPPPFLSQAWIGGALEFFGGLLIILGLFTRPVAFILSGMMAVAYFQFHAIARTEFWPILNGGELAALYCFVFLYMSAAGGGRWSLDYIWRHSK